MKYLDVKQLFKRGIYSSKPPQRLLIGEHPEYPVITIEPSTAQQEYEEAHPLPTQNAEYARLSALVQAVPSLLVGGAAHGKKLMEVVINGELTRASDGNGFRAFA